MLRRRALITLALSIAISVTLLVLLFHWWPKGTWGRLLSSWSWPPLFLYTAISLCGAFLRTVRYQWLLRPERRPFLTMFLLTLIRNFTVDLLPMRSGSLSFPTLLHYRAGVAWPWAWSSYAWSIVWDFVSLAVFLWCAWVILLGKISGAGWLCILPASLSILAGILIFMPEKITRFLITWAFYYRRSFIGRFIRRFLFRQRRFLRGLVLVARGPKRTPFIPLLLLSIAVRAAKYFSLYSLYIHFLSQMTDSSKPASLAQFIWTLTFAEMTAALPFQGLMNIGPWETAWTLAFNYLQVHQKSIGAVLSTLVHWTSQIWEYSIGGIALVILLSPLMGKKRMGPVPGHY